MSSRLSHQSTLFVVVVAAAAAVVVADVAVERFQLIVDVVDAGFRLRCCCCRG